MNTRLVIFDVAGTTVLDGDLVIDAMSEALSAHGFVVDRDWIRGRMGLPKPVAIRELVSRSSVAGSSDLDVKAARVHRTFLELAGRGYRHDPACARPLALARCSARSTTNRSRSRSIPASTGSP